jgi:anti-anti-sigma regulatory factor
VTTSTAKLLVFVSAQLACVKITGRANFASSIDFKTLIHELLAKGFTCFVLDLTECVLMDSTFLGVLAGLGLQLSSGQSGQPTGEAIELMNPNPRVSELLENLGVLHLFRIVTGPVPQLANGKDEPAAYAGVTATREEVVTNCLEAHKLLMALDPANIPKFKEVTQFLAEDLKRIKDAH